MLEKLEAMKTERSSAAINSSERHAWDFTKEKALPVFATDGEIQLRPFRESDKPTYYSIRKQWFLVAPDSMFDEDSDILWNHAMEESAFFCMAEWRGISVGYVAIHDTRESTWELAVEFDKQYCYKGLGPKCILLFLREIEKHTMISLFRARVEVDNLACQKCMAKIGASLVGLSEGILKTDEEQSHFEDENLEKIDDHMRDLANALNVEPRKLLSHVLEYEIVV